MTENVCKPLTDHIAERRENGLVDIKFYVHDLGDATPAKVCAEAEAIFDAIKGGAVEDFTLGHRAPMAERA